MLPASFPPKIMHSLAAAVVDELVAIHDSCKARGATPLDYVSFLHAYDALYNGQVKH